MTLPCLAAQVLADTSMKPWPLQEFRPLQPWLPDLQALWPLHELMPKQWTFAIVPAWAGIANVAAAAIAKAAAASAAPDFDVWIMMYSSVQRAHMGTCGKNRETANDMQFTDVLRAP
jgi:hypothetical protein